MVNAFLDIQRLRASLRARGLDEDTVDVIASKADAEIQTALSSTMESAMELAVQSGVQKDSPEFINELRPSPDAFLLETESGNMDFSDPPMPMLDKLLRNAKPMKDGSGVYKVVPVGTSSTKRRISTNIFDAQKSIMAERYSEAVSQNSKVKPKGSKEEFRTATSKQSQSTQWVRPAKDKDFTEDLREINGTLETSTKDIIEQIIRSYEDRY